MRSAEVKMHTFIQVMKNAFNSVRVRTYEAPGYERERERKEKHVTCNAIEDSGTTVVKKQQVVYILGGYKW